MIETPTVLILGAGASVDFGFPSGRSLVDEVLAATTTQSFEEDSRTRFAGDLIGRFRDDLRYSGSASVDRFLELRRDYLDIGKFAIARVLIGRESQQRIFGAGRAPRPASWLEFLFGKLATQLGSFENSELSILTFNYDRSVEFYFRTALRASRNLDQEALDHELGNVPIVHLYGDLGSLAAGQDFRPYTVDLSGVPIAVRRLRLIPEERPVEDGAFEMAQELLASARRVYFLGFGFDWLNLDRIRPEVPIAADISGTCLGMTDRERRDSERLVRDWARADVPVELRHENCLEFMRERAQLS